MSTQKWKLVVTPLGGSEVLHQVEVEANNWMGALRSGRECLGERPSMPPGASCSIDAQGTATVLDPQGRRKFVLAPVGGDGSGGAAATPPQYAAASQAVAPAKGKKKRFETVAFIPEQMKPPAAAPAEAKKKKKFQTMAYMPGMELPGMPKPAAAAPAAEPTPAPEPASKPIEVAPPQQPASAASIEQAAMAATDPPPPQPAPASATEDRKRFDTVGFAGGQPIPPVSTGPSGGVQPPELQPPEPAPPELQPPTSPSTPSAAPAPTGSQAPGAIEASQLELLLERNDDPTVDNPLCYRERAYLLPRGAKVPDAEAALRWRLADLQRELSERPRGKLINLAVFDHRWEGAPERPPLIVLQWRDWRPTVEVDYPAAQITSDLAPGPEDDRLADVFAALEGLGRLKIPVDGLDYVVGVLEQAIPCEATSACLYDINTDELRFVSVIGQAAQSMQGTAIPRAAGLIGKAVQAPTQVHLFDDVMLEPSFNQTTDSRPGLDARNMLVRALSHDGHLHGVLQLVNRRVEPGFTTQDANLLNYVADRLCEFLQAVRTVSARPPH